MDEHLSQSIDLQADRQSVLADLCRTNDQLLFLDFVTAVGRVVRVGVAGDRVGGECLGGFGVDGASQHQLKTVVLRPDLLHLKRGLSCPDQALQAIGGRAQAAPATVAEPGKQAAVAALGEPDHRPRFTSWLLQESVSATTPPELTQQEVWAGRYEVRDGPEVRLS